MRRKIVAANWKMNKTVPEALEFVNELKSGVRETEEAELVVCPPFTALYPVSRAIEGTCIKLGAQDVYFQEKGAFTGEVSPVMLTDLHCDYAIVGHSERRGYFRETDIDVNKKLRALLDHGIRPIVCVGETLEQREAGHTEELVTRQVEIAFDGVGQNEVTSVVIAYEPIWAIGTGRSATGEDANRVIGLIRRTWAEYTRMRSQERQDPVWKRHRTTSRVQPPARDRRRCGRSQSEGKLLPGDCQG